MKFYLKNPIVRVFICHCMQSEKDLVCVLCKKFLHLLSRQLLWPVREKGRTRKTLTSICQLVDGLCDVSKTLGILQLCQNKTFQAGLFRPESVFKEGWAFHNACFEANLRIQNFSTFHNSNVSRWSSLHILRNFFLQTVGSESQPPKSPWLAVVTCNHERWTK